MDKCIHCKAYHQPFEVCGGYIEDVEKGKIVPKTKSIYYIIGQIEGVIDSAKIIKPEFVIALEDIKKNLAEYAGLK